MKLKDLIMEAFTLTGRVMLYHFSKEDLGNVAVLDPALSSQRPSSWSRNDYRLSKVPRVFYYTDLNKIERMVKSDNLYTAEYDGTRILNVPQVLKEYQTNPDSLAIKNPNAFKIMQSSVNQYGVLDYDAMLRAAGQFFDGVFYDTGNLPIVNLFVPLRAKKQNV